MKWRLVLPGEGLWNGNCGMETVEQRHKIS